MSLHKKWSSLLIISSENVTKFAGNYGLGHIYWIETKFSFNNDVINDITMIIWLPYLNRTCAQPQGEKWQLKEEVFFVLRVLGKKIRWRCRKISEVERHMKSCFGTTNWVLVHLPLDLVYENVSVLAYDKIIVTVSGVSLLQTSLVSLLRINVLNLANNPIYYLCAPTRYQ